MKEVLSTHAMRKNDSYTIANFTPSLELMYNAAMGIYKNLPLENSPAGGTACADGRDEPRRGRTAPERF